MVLHAALHRVPPACMSAENQATPSLIYYSNLSCISFVNPSRPPPFILCCCLALMQCTWSQHDPKWLVPFFKARTVPRASNDRSCWPYFSVIVHFLSLSLLYHDRNSSQRWIELWYSDRNWPVACLAWEVARFAGRRCCVSIPITLEVARISIMIGIHLRGW